MSYAERFKLIAVVIGSTGLVGSEVIKALFARPDVEKVKSFVRRPSQTENLPGSEKLEEHIVDFAKVETWKKLLIGDALFSCLGTTRSQAGSKAAQYKVDYQYQLDVARMAKEWGVQTYILISSIGADANSPFFYLKMKGQLERDVETLGFAKTRILRPAPLKGRHGSRLGEQLGIRVLELALPLFPKGLKEHLRPVEARTVAEIAVRSAFKEHLGTLVYDSANIRLDK